MAFDKIRVELSDNWAEIVVSELKKRGNLVAVIRCKDCKWFNQPGCAINIVDDSDKPKENDYCSFAEVKEDEAE